MGHVGVASSVDTPGEPQPTGRTLEEATAEIGQRPLLPAEVPAGITVAVARRSRKHLADFHGWRLPGASPADGQEEVAQACVLVVSETSLVHYSKRPKPLGKVCSTAASPREETAGGSKTSNASPETADAEPPVDEKYWKRRYNYFARFDEGVRMDPAAWFEVTPESVARHIADRMKYDLVVDGTCGVGGNAIQFALTSKRVVAVDTAAERLEDAAHNASIYGVKERIEFVCDDFAHFAETYKGPQIDAVFLSPPWGGPAHLDAEHFALKDVECPDIVRLFAAAAAVSRRVVLYLPRHADLHEMVLLAYAHGFGAVEVEKVFFEYPTPHLKLCVVYFWPEAAAHPPAVAKSSKKKVGPTGIPAGKPNASEVVHSRSSPAPFKQLPRQPRDARPCGLLGLPPLVGPLYRAMYCRFHYVGRYAVAVALAFDRQQDVTPSRRSSPAAPRRPPRSPSPARMGNASRTRASGRSRGEQPVSPQPASLPTLASASQCHPALRAPVASALCKAFNENYVKDAEQESRIAWLLAEVPLSDFLCLAGDAANECAASDAADAWGLQVIQLVQQRLPEVYCRMMDWRKARALQAASVTSA